MNPFAPYEGTGVVGMLHPGAGTKAAPCVGLPTGGSVAFACFSSTVGAYLVSNIHFPFFKSDVPFEMYRTEDNKCPIVISTTLWVDD